MICISSTTDGDARVDVPHRRGVCRQPRKALIRLCLPLLLLLLAAGALALQDLLTVLVELELGDDDLGGSDRDGDGLAVGLLADDCRLWLAAVV